MMAAQAAAAAAARQFNIEAFTLLGVGLTVTILRTYVRVSSVGVKRLQVDDYLVWFAAVSKPNDRLSENIMSNRSHHRYATPLRLLWHTLSVTQHMVLPTMA
jgi:hypothetical protein